jgi:hypothetical protein
MQQPKPQRKTRALGPHIPAPYTIAEAAAIQALVRGDAEPHQQQIAVRWLIEQAAGAYEFQYYPTDRDTAFALGRAFVGQQIVKLSKLNTQTLRRDEE